MRARKLFLALAPALLAGALAGCSYINKSPDVTDNIRKSLDQAGYKDVSVSQDRDKGVVTLTGTVPTDSDKAQAESIAKSGAGSQVVAGCDLQAMRAMPRRWIPIWTRPLRRIWTPFWSRTR